jgi:hypothetical protein
MESSYCSCAAAAAAAAAQCYLRCLGKACASVLLLNSVTHLASACEDAL